MIIGVLFLEETHEDKKDRRDIGLEIGDWMLNFWRSETVAEKGDLMNEGLYLLADERSSGYSTMRCSPTLSATTLCADEMPQQIPATDLSVPVKQKLGVASAFTKQVVLLIVSYGLLA